jgi:outer membrane lipoprotein-sorting protein
MLNIEHRSKMLSGLAAEAVPDSTDIWPALCERLPTPRGLGARQVRRPLLGLSATAAALIAIVAVGVSPFWNAPEAVNAETILDRAETAASTGASSVSTYHLLMTRTTPDASTVKSEVWFGGPDRQRTIEQVFSAGGAAVSRQDVVFNGPEAWIETRDNGITRVVHTFGTTWTRPAESPSNQPDLSELLRTFGDKACMAARLEQTLASVAGKETYVIVARPATYGCRPSPSTGAVEASPEPSDGQSRIRVNGQPAGGLLTQPTELTVWVDRQSFLPLKMEVRDGRGKVVDRFEVTRVEYNVSVPDSMFAYAPPPGVSVATFSGGDGADVKRTLASESGLKPLHTSP